MVSGILERALAEGEKLAFIAEDLPTLWAATRAMELARSREILRR